MEGREEEVFCRCLDFVELLWAVKVDHSPLAKVRYAKVRGMEAGTAGEKNLGPRGRARTPRPSDIYMDTVWNAKG